MGHSKVNTTSHAYQTQDNWRQLQVLGSWSTTSCNEHTPIHLGFQVQALPQWIHEEVQDLLLNMRRSTTRRNRLFWNVDTSSTMVYYLHCAKLGVKLGYKSVQCDITTVFIHTLLQDKENIYIKQPCSSKERQTMSSASVVCSMVSSKHHNTSSITLPNGSSSKVVNGLFTILALHELINASHCICWWLTDLWKIRQTKWLIYLSMQNEEICLQKVGTAEGYLDVDMKDNQQLFPTYPKQSQQTNSQCAWAQHNLNQLQNTSRNGTITKRCWWWSCKQNHQLCKRHWNAPLSQQTYMF